MIKAAIHKTFRAFGLDVIQLPPQERAIPPDFGNDEAEIISEFRPWTMTSPERMYALIQAVRYVSANAIVGAIVEWFGRAGAWPPSRGRFYGRKT